MEKQVKNIDASINLQPYFNQVVASNLVVAFFTAKQSYPEKTDIEVYDLLVQMFAKVSEILEMIPVKVVSPKKEKSK